MRFSPKTQREIDEAGLMVAGTYNVQITDAEEMVSKAGNDMIKLTLTVWDGSGAERRIYDYLLEAIASKLLHCAEMCGLMQEYKDGTLRAESLIGKCGQAKVIIQKDKTGAYPDRNSIADYLIGPPAKMPERKKPAMADIDDDIPF